VAGWTAGFPSTWSAAEERYSRAYFPYSRPSACCTPLESEGERERVKERRESACVIGMFFTAGPGTDHYDFGQDVLFRGSAGVAPSSGSQKLDRVNLAKLVQDYRPELVPKGCILMGNDIHSTVR